MLVNARLLYILVDGLHYSSGGQVILTIARFYIPAIPIVRIRATKYSANYCLKKYKCSGAQLILLYI